MMLTRGRAWRRHIEDKKVIKRLKFIAITKNWWSFEDANNAWLKDPCWYDLISTRSATFLKNSTTDRYSTRRKTKWGKSGKKNWNYSFSPWTRHKEKQRTQKEVKNELGFLFTQ